MNKVIFKVSGKRLLSSLSVVALLLSGLFLSMPSAARQIDDVTVPDVVTLDDTDVELKLNGAGYRTKFVFNIYVGALYTSQPVKTRDEVQALAGPKRVSMTMVYDEVSHEKMADAWQEGFEDNTTDDGYEKLKSRLSTFIGYFPDLKAGDVIMMDYIPASGTHVTINDELKGVIEGADFYTALLDVWLGDEPADEELKEAMLGDDDD